MCFFILSINMCRAFKLWLSHLAAVNQMLWKKKLECNFTTGCPFTAYLDLHKCVYLYKSAAMRELCTCGLVCVCVRSSCDAACVIHVGAGGTYWPALRLSLILSTAVIWLYTQPQVQLRLFIHYPYSWKILQSFMRMRFGNQLIFRATCHLHTRQLWNDTPEAL